MKSGFSHLVCLILLFADFVYDPDGLDASGRTPRDERPPVKHFADVRLARDYRLPETRRLQFKGAAVTIDLYARSFSQGMAVYAELYADPAVSGKTVTIKKLLFENREIPMSERNWGYRALFGLSPDIPAGSRLLVVASVADGNHRTESFPISVAATRYEFNPRALDLGRYSDIDYKPTPEEAKFIDECVRKKKQVFGRLRDDGLSGSLSHPRDYHYITSPFYAKRTIMRYKKIRGKKIRHKDRVNVHRGLDLRGKTGELLFAMASGTVAIAEPMYYEGNFIVIDHGNRVFTCYMHCDSINVRAGSRVRAGEMIGRVGTTGLSTAAHLHVSLFVQDVPVDPLSLLVLPVRD